MWDRGRNSPELRSFPIISLMRKPSLEVLGGETGEEASELIAESNARPPLLSVDISQKDVKERPVDWPSTEGNKSSGAWMSVAAERECHVGSSDIRSSFSMRGKGWRERVVLLWTLPTRRTR